MNPYGKLRMVLQELLDSEPDGWQLAHYVVVMGLQKLDSEGLRSTTWVATEAAQPDYVTDGLLAAGEDMRAAADVLDEDD